MRKILHTVLTTALMMLLPVSAQAGTFTQTEATKAQEASKDEYVARYKYAVDVVNIRQEPSIDSVILGRLTPSNAILVIGEVPNGEVRRMHRLY